MRKDRDIVLVDQRGTGRSSPLTCAAFKPDDSAEATLELDPVPKAAACAKELAVQGVDAAQYTTAAWIADLDAVRAALGYAKINLWGGSYGTRAALEYLRRHPSRVRSIVLDGVAPPSMKVSLDVWPSRDLALSAVLDACAQSPACRAAHPDLPAMLDGIRDRLGPKGRDIALIDPRTGGSRRSTSPSTTSSARCSRSPTLPSSRRCCPRSSAARRPATTAPSTRARCSSPPTSPSR